jgi:hypothetical protein
MPCSMVLIQYYYDGYSSATCSPTSCQKNEQPKYNSLIKILLEIYFRINNNYYKFEKIF